MEEEINQQPPVEQPEMGKKKFPIIRVVIGVAAVLVVVGIAFTYFQFNRISDPLVCNDDTKPRPCSDGSHVGRIPPDCAFAECPEDSDEIKEEQALSNLRLHRNAVETNNSHLCDMISGVGYGFGFVDELIYIEQEEATEWCKKDVEAGLIINGEFQELIKSKLLPLPIISIYGPSEGEVLERGETYPLEWKIENLPSDIEKWTLVGHEVIPGHAYDGKVGPEIFSYPLSENPGNYDWVVGEGNRTDEWWEMRKERGDLNREDFYFNVRVCIVKNDEIFALGRWSDYLSDTAYCNNNVEKFFINY